MKSGDTHKIDTKGNPEIYRSFIMFYVYVWRDFDGVPFYVGKGTGKRMFSRNRNIFFNRKLGSIETKSGKTVFPEIHTDNLTEEQAFELEISLISEYRSNGFKLTNLTNGGEGWSGAKHSEETKRILSISAKSRGPVSTSTREKMSQSKRIWHDNNTVGEDTRKLLSEINRGEKNSMSSLTEPEVREIFQMVLDGVSRKEIKRVILEKYGKTFGSLSKLRNGKRWNHIGKEFSENMVGSTGKPFIYFGREFCFEVMEEITKSVLTIEEIRVKFNFKTTREVVKIANRTSWKNAWKIYELQRLSKGHQ